MVARINTSKDIGKALNYNEQKVQQGKAEILSESGFIKDVDKLDFFDKIGHFESLTSLNERASTNALHVSLNFDPSEKIINEKMIEIADAYMNKIGFGDQPYLVYRHYDAGHPHIHIVSTNIQKDGDRISMHNLGRNQSEKARKEIEKEFGLVKADSKKAAESAILAPVNVQKVIYGRSETKQAISNVLSVVVNQYKYTSLAELNTVLKQYNVQAERGSERSKTYKGKGLVFRVLDANGNKIGAPIKASAFYMKPTLANLEKKFIENESLRAPHKKKIQTKINWVLNKNPPNVKVFVKDLEKESINVILHTGEAGVIYGITFIDRQSKSVFNGSDLGKTFSANAVLAKCSQNVIAKSTGVKFDSADQRKKLPPGGEKSKGEAIDDKSGKTDYSLQIKFKIPELLAPASNFVPFQLTKKKKKKKKRISI